MSTSIEQNQTADSFGYKWARRETYDSPAVQASSRAWIYERYLDGDPSRVDAWLEGGRKRILDAGCGASFGAILLFGDRLKDHDYIGVDISSAVDVAKARFDEAGYPGTFIQSDLFSCPIPDESVDIVYSDGVLHHTDSVERSILHLAKKLKSGGRFLFYVYRRKGPVREFTDDHVRNAIQPLSDEAAWEALMPLTKLGIALGELDVEVDVPEDIAVLGIPAGRINVQRLFYWHVAKMYYRPEWSIDEMNHVNFDWFRPLNCHRHTTEEIVKWCGAAGLTMERLKVEEAGISVIGVKT